RFHREGAWRIDPRLGQRGGLPADPLPRARRRQPWAPVQGVGAAFHGGEPILVQRLHRIHGRSDRASRPHRRRLAETETQSSKGSRMGTGPVTDSGDKKRPSWKLKPPHDALTQAIVVSGFNTLPCGQALFLCCDWPENGPDADVTPGRGAW